MDFSQNQSEEIDPNQKLEYENIEIDLKIIQPDLDNVQSDDMVQVTGREFNEQDNQLYTALDTPSRLITKQNSETQTRQLKLQSNPQNIQPQPKSKQSTPRGPPSRSKVSRNSLTRASQNSRSSSMQRKNDKRYLLNECELQSASFNKADEGNQLQSYRSQSNIQSDDIARLKLQASRRKWMIDNDITTVTNRILKLQNEIEASKTTEQNLLLKAYELEKQHDDHLKKQDEVKGFKMLQQKQVNIKHQKTEMRREEMKETKGACLYMKDINFIQDQKQRSLNNLIEQQAKEKQKIHKSIVKFNQKILKKNQNQAEQLYTEKKEFIDERKKRELEQQEENRQRFEQEVNSIEAEDKKKRKKIEAMRKKEAELIARLKTSLQQEEVAEQRLEQMMEEEDFQ
ncbi:MAG: hypothetical protein EZS28_008015 [Streblomastix strix]|uniref:Uncharacterized protein n=1 Tax=Streblomastix strix TaxID=222440 RepID=A0A5J4WND5_9EUKA|nr:MAG: hypothetical protein EZS28_008015 [Streblomastix strix]